MRVFATSITFVTLLALTAPAFATTGAITPRSAVHDGVWRNDVVEWHSRYEPEWIAPGDSETWRLKFALPLPPETKLSSAGDASLQPVRDPQGRIVAADFAGDDGAFSTELRTTIPAGDRIDPPLAPDVVQRVELSGARVRPPPGSPLALRLTSIRHRDVDGDAADRLDHRWGEATGASRPIVLVPDRAYLDSGGLGPSMVDESDATAGNIAFLAGALFVVLAVLGGLLKLVSRAARAEEAEAFLADFDVDQL